MYKYRCIVYLYTHRIKYAKPISWDSSGSNCLHALKSNFFVVLLSRNFHPFKSSSFKITVFWDLTPYRLVSLCEILSVISQKTIFSIVNRVRTTNIRCRHFIWEECNLDDGGFYCRKSECVLWRKLHIGNWKTNAFGPVYPRSVSSHNQEIKRKLRKK